MINNYYERSEMTWKSFKITNLLSFLCIIGRNEALILLMTKE